MKEKKYSFISIKIAATVKLLILFFLQQRSLQLQTYTLSKVLFFYSKADKLLFLFLVCNITTFFICAYKLFPFFYHISATFFTSNSRRFLPAHKITFRIIDTTVILSTLLCLFENNIFSRISP